MAYAKGAEIKIDTVYKDREVIMPEIWMDSVVHNVNFIDTVIVEKDRIVTRVKVNTIEKKVYVKTTCKADTIKINQPVYINKYMKTSEGIKWWWLLIAFIAGAIAILLWK